MGILVETTRRIEDSVATGFRDVRQDMAEMRRETVTRNELDQRLGVVVEDVTELKSDAADAKRERRVERRWRWGLAAGAATAFGAAIISHVPWH